eukprot:TRINITY_DN10333_c0_g1_i1.p1 TRINITY_DN10333_c0_g1~~TRINITY_DN10333_c0_g1_i1.p1  ORF type:complete len:1063 (+),score=244.11 TRINITY_DN10333_c0_g1_i1:56-3244(+)
MSGAKTDDKQHFDDIYVLPNPCGFKNEIMDKLDYVCDDFTKREFDKAILPFCSERENLVLVDLCCCFGNTTMAVVNNMSSHEIRKNWASEESCEKIDKPRRFACKTIGVDLSGPAVEYGRRTGIFDEGVVGDLNSMTSEFRTKMQEVLGLADVVVCTAALVYLNVSVIDQLLHNYASSSKEEGFMIVNFLNPFNPDKADATKQVLLRHLDFVSSCATRHRKLSEFERKLYPGEEWALLEIWVLKRKPRHLRVMMNAPLNPTRQTKMYYDSHDAMTFYSKIWGGEDLHIGIYEEGSSIREASDRTVEYMMSKLQLDATKKLLDVGAGFGGCARTLAQKTGCHVTCLDLSDSGCARNEMLNRQAGLQDQIKVVQGAFEKMPFEDQEFDIVWSEDSLLHSTDRAQVLTEISRVLRPGGEIIFTDIMQSDSASPEDLKVIYSRIHLTSLGSPRFYQTTCTDVGFEAVEFQALTENVGTHYSAVLKELESRQDELRTVGVTQTFIDRQKDGLRSWIAAHKTGLIVWGLIHAIKPKTAVPYDAVTVTSLPPPVNRVKCVVTGATRTHEADRHDTPVSWVEIGGQPVLVHVLHQLYLAGVRAVVVQLGVRGESLRNSIEQRQAELFPDLALEIQDLGPRFRGGHMAAIQMAHDYIKDEEMFLLCPGDHIYDEKLIMSFIAAGLHDMDAARMLVENDLKGMVGLPSCTVYVASRPLHSADHVYQLGRHLAAYSGIDAGLLLARPELCNRSSSQAPYAIVADLLQECALHGTLVQTTTAGRTWFSVETDDSAAYAQKQIARVGHPVRSDDGNVSYLVGLPKRSKVKAPTGNDWAAFSVAKWRSAVFTTKGYFEQLYKDVTSFIADFARQFGGPEKVLLVEVGSGTGEALLPLYDHCKYAIGVDINPIFTDFCKESLPKEFSHKVEFIVGNAAHLGDLLERKKPEWLVNTNKVVFCVGNTIGIIPEELRPSIYKEMAALAGPSGVAVMGYWNGRYFGDAVQHFYAPNPQLCGPFTGECIDMASRTLRTPSGYCTHWTTAEEARDIMLQYGLRIVSLEEYGKGVLVAFRLPHE